MPQHTAPPRQERSRQTLERLLGAAEEVFADVGEPGFTIPEVSRRAGLSVGTVYRRFANKEELLLAVMQRVQRDDTHVIAGWAAIDWERIDPRTMVGQLARDLSKPWRERAPLMRAVMARRLKHADGQLLGQGLQVVTNHVALFREAILTHASALQHPDPDEAIEFGYRIIISTCARWTAAAIETQAPKPMSWETMLERVTDIVTAYLFGLDAIHPVTPTLSRSKLASQGRDAPRLPTNDDARRSRDDQRSEDDGEDASAPPTLRTPTTNSGHPVISRTLSDPHR